jgi:hypothetical protein
LPLQKINDPYKNVSLIYPELMKFVSYKWWARYIYFISRKHIKKKAEVLELASGNCSLAKYLKKQFSNYVSTDLSLSMLKSSEINSDRVCCDMTRLPFKRKFDLIFTAFDSINYLTSKKQLRLLFNEMNKLLSDDGIFTFDAALESNSYKHQKTASDKGKLDGYFYARKSIYLPKSRIHKNIFRIIKPDGEIVTEIHRQKIFPYRTYFEEAEKSNLYVVNCYKAFSIQRGSEKSDRVQFILKRKQ